MLIRLKSCPRCKGDLLVDWDYHGRYLECLQCGYLSDLQGQRDAKEAEKGKEPALAVR